MVARNALKNPGMAWAYARAVVSGIGSKAVAGVSGLALVWLLNAILGKDGFAYCMIGLTLNQTIALVVASGFENIVLYHVSRLDHSAEAVRSRQLAAAGLCSGAAVALLLAAAVFGLADQIAAWAGKPEAGVWIRIFAPTIPLSVINTVQAGWIQARQMIPTSVFFAVVLPNVLRVVLLLFVWLFAGDSLGVGGAMAVALLIPVVWLYLIQPTPLVSPLRLLTRWDLKYGLTVMFGRLADQRIQSIGVLIVGLLATAAETADFVLAARFALMLVMLQMGLNQLLAPRLGALMSRGNPQQLRKEYDGSRFVALLAAIAGAIGFLLFAPLFLPLFGDYGGAYPILTILSAAMIVRVGFGASGQYLIMSGHAGWRLINSLGSLVVLVALSYVLVSPFGGEGAAVAAFVSVLSANGMAAVIIWFLDRLNTVSANLLLAMALASTLLLFAGFGLLSPLIAAGCLSVIGALVLLLYRDMWWPWIGRIRGGKSPA